MPLVFNGFQGVLTVDGPPVGHGGGALSVIKHERQIIQCPMRTYGLVTPGGLPGGPLMPHGRSDKSSNVASAQVFVLLQLKLGGR